MGKARKCNCEDISDHYTGTVPEQVHPESEVWIREGNPVTAEDAARLAESFMSARRRNQDVTFSQENHQAQSGKSFGGEGGLVNHKSCIFQNVGSLAFKLPATKKVCSLLNRKLGINIWLPFFGQ